MKHLQSGVNNLDLHDKLETMKSKNEKSPKKSKGRVVISKEGIKYTIVDDMEPSNFGPSILKKFAELDEKIRKAGLPNFPPREK